jgi:hypothetical protein
MHELRIHLQINVRVVVLEQHFRLEATLCIPVKLYYVHGCVLGIVSVHRWLGHKCAHHIHKLSNEAAMCHYQHSFHLRGSVVRSYAFTQL